MVNIPEDKIVAPYVGTVSEGKAVPSFAGYFLRDLHQQGRLNTEVVLRVIEEHGIESTFDEVMAAISDHRGESVSETLDRDLATIASVGSSMN